MEQWTLVEHGEALSEEELPRKVIASRRELEEALTELERRPPTEILLLREGAALHLGIGGALGKIGWEAGATSANAITMAPTARKPVGFRCAGEEMLTEPRFLLPSKEVRRLVLEFFDRGELPRWVDWEIWRPDSLQWELLARTVCSS
jgi:hypothetical protein